MRLLTHNVWWFQGCPPRWGEERVAERSEVLEALTALYRAARPDVLCLQEVHRVDLVERLARELGMAAFLHAPGGRRADYGGAVLARNPARLRDLTHHPARAAPHDRVHLRASIGEAGGMLEIAAVHLPSDRYAASHEAGQEARVAELARILQDAARPQLVAGDMNSRPGSLPYRFMADNGYVDAALAAGAPEYRNRIDYIWIEAGLAGALRSFRTLDSGAFIRRDSAGAEWRLSDHPPLVAEFDFKSE